jgi:endo-1,4-beta-xylanase
MTPRLPLRTRVLSVALIVFAGASVAEEPDLKTRMPPGVLIGAALNPSQTDGRDPVAAEIVRRHFNTISPENVLKWGPVHPEPERYAFELADRYVAFGEQNGMVVIGHNLVWHNQTPSWVFAGKDGARADRETLLTRMRGHIQTVVGRYRGRIRGWDVVNEAMNEDGTWRKSPWFEVLGDDFVFKAFEYAHAADPQAELYYNDFNLAKPQKRAGVLRLVKQLKERGLRIDAVGEQGHWQLARPPLEDLDATITEIHAAGVKVMLTELDVDVLPRSPEMEGADLAQQARTREATNLYPDGLPAEQQRHLAERYAAIFGLISKRREMLTRVTFWGVTDRTSWLNNFPVRGRVNYPLLWDREGAPKPAFAAVLEALRKAISSAH